MGVFSLRRSFVGLTVALVTTITACDGTGVLSTSGASPGSDDEVIVATLSVSNGWRSIEASEPASGTVEFDIWARPSVAEIGAGVALGAEDLADSSDAAIEVRFGKDGLLQARNGSVYDSHADYTYQASRWYRFTISADIPARTYDVRIRDHGSPEDGYVLIDDAAFNEESNAIGQLTHWAAWSSQEAELDVAEASWTAAGNCGPASCASLGVACGTPSDGCGASLNCGACPSDQTCESGACVCARASCVSLGIECGSPPDGCGGNLNCGGCATGESCIDGVCVEVSPPPPASCIPESCVSLAKECDTWADGCGGTLACGGCPNGQACGDGTCVDVSPPPPPPCVPDSCGSLGVECGTVGNGCGGTLRCGNCPGGQDCEAGQCVDVSPPPCVPDTCASLGLSCGQANDGCGGMVNCGSCSSGATVLWSSTEQTQGLPFNLDWTTCENPISSVVGCQNGDGDGAELGRVSDPGGGSGYAIRQYADLRSGGGRSQGAVLAQGWPAIDALFDNQEEIWFYTEYYFPEPVVGSGWLHFFGFQQTGNAGRIANNPAINFWSEDDSSGGYLPGDMEIGIYWTDFTQLEKATMPMPVGKWVEFELMYKRSSGNGARDGAAQIWIDDHLVLDQQNIETWQSGHGNLEIYWNLYGETWANDWNDPSPEYYIRNLRIGDAKMSTGYLR